MNLIPSKYYEIDITGVESASDTGADCAFQGIWFTAAGAANAPVDPAFTPDGGAVEGNSTVNVASTYAQKVFYCWSDNSTAPSQGDAGYTQAEGASVDVTVPNEPGTKYLHAYGWNNKNTNTYTNTITKTFTITAGKALPELAYAETEVAKYTIDANFTNALTNPHDLTVTYSVADGATATGVEVNASTGEVTIGSIAGTATIKATFAGDETYQAGEASYVLTVTKPTCAIPTYTLGSYNYEQEGYEIVPSCATDGATLQYKIGSGDYTTCIAGEAFYAKGGKLVIKASKDGYNDATIASGDQWTLNGAPSATSPETLIPFQTSSDNGEKNKAHVYKSVTFGENNAASSVGGVSGANGLKIRCNQTHDEIANSIKFYVHSGYKVTNIRMTGISNNNNAGQTIDVNGMYIDGGDNAISSVEGNKTFPISSADPATFNTGDIEATNNIVLTFDNSNVESGNKQLKVDIVVTYAPTSVTITPANNKSTYVTTQALDFSDVEGLKAYVATAADAGVVTLEPVDAVPAGTPLMLVGTAGTGYTVPVAAEASTPAKNMFVAGDGTTEFNAESTTSYDYILSTDGKFYRIATGTTVPVGKAYLHCTSDPIAVGDSARGLRISFGDITGVDNVEAAAEAKAQDGKFIENGKLVIVKNGQKYNAAGQQVK